MPETKLYVRCTYENATKGGVYGEDPDYVEAFTNNRGKLFRDCVKEYGRCTSKIYTDNTTDGSLGWVFEKRAEYDNHRGNGPTHYLQKTWVHVKQVVQDEAQQDDPTTGFPLLQTARDS